MQLLLILRSQIKPENAASTLAGQTHFWVLGEVLLVRLVWMQFNYLTTFSPTCMVSIFIGEKALPSLPVSTTHGNVEYACVIESGEW